jgi:hypothetical protein
MIIEGIAHWAKVQQPAENYDRTGYEWTIDVEVTEEEASKAEEQGLRIIDKDGVLFVKIKQKVEKKDGGSNKAPIVVDANNMPTQDLIGNGSQVRVQYRTYEWTFGRKKGTSAALQAVQIVELVAYEGGQAQAGAEFGSAAPAAKATKKPAAKADAPF